MTGACLERLAVLVHEVRSPVAALAAIAETFRDSRLEIPARRRLVELAIAACRGIERVVTDAAVASIRLEHVDIGCIVEEAVAAAVLGGGSVSAEIRADLPTLDVDPLRLRQALDNLVSNGVVHSGGGRVVVRARSEDRSVMVSVEDHGPGIASQDQERVFEPGIRLGTGGPGSGLGLAVARAIVEAHAGTLQVESTPGEGTIFTVTLPY